MNCIICGKRFSKENCFNEYTIKHGNNAEPVASGKCCDVCDKTRVIPERIRRVTWSENTTHFVRPEWEE